MRRPRTQALRHEGRQRVPAVQLLQADALGALPQQLYQPHLPGHQGVPAGITRQRPRCPAAPAAAAAAASCVDAVPAAAALAAAALAAAALAAAAAAIHLNHARAAAHGRCWPSHQVWRQVGAATKDGRQASRATKAIPIRLHIAKGLLVLLRRWHGAGKEDGGGGWRQGGSRHGWLGIPVVKWIHGAGLEQPSSVQSGGPLMGQPSIGRKAQRREQRHARRHSPVAGKWRLLRLLHSAAVACMASSRHGEAHRHAV